MSIFSVLLFFIKIIFEIDQSLVICLKVEM